MAYYAPDFSCTLGKRNAERRPDPQRIIINLGGNMSDSINQTRRTFMKIGGVAMAMIPVAAFAAKNDAMRTAMKYADKSTDAAKICTGCMHFVPGKTPKDLGGCKLFPNDTEVNPAGGCTAWAKKP
jgi:hypothetical protein